MVSFISWNISKVKIDYSLVKYLPEKIARRYNVFPIQIAGDTIVFAISCPVDLVALDDIRVIVGKNIKFGDVKKPMIMTSVDLTDGKTHFFKTSDSQDASFSMTEMCKRSFAAPLFFGAILDYETKSVWSDGGTGMHNLPLIEAYGEALQRGWLDEGHRTHILALGTGRKEYRVPFKKFAKHKGIDIMISV